MTSHGQTAGTLAGAMEGMKREMARAKEHQAEAGAQRKGGNRRKKTIRGRKSGEMLSEHKVIVNEGCCHEADKN